MTGYFAVKDIAEHTIVIERSKFICLIKQIENEEQAKSFLESVAKKYSLANHHCYAYIADENGNNFKFSDDGEPQGTAGMPILQALKNRNFCKTVAVVVRYFGGIKLGAGGLTRAYSNSVVECLNHAKILFYKPVIFYQIKTDYENYSNFLKVCKNHGLCVIDTDFSGDITLKFAIDNDEKSINNFLNLTADFFKGKNLPIKSGEGYFGVEDVNSFGDNGSRKA